MVHQSLCRRRALLWQGPPGRSRTRNCAPGIGPAHLTPPLRCEPPTPTISDVTNESDATAERSDEELRLGDLVVLMSEPGPFTVVEIDPPAVVIESAMGQRRKVLDVAVRRSDTEPPVNT